MKNTRLCLAIAAAIAAPPYCRHGLCEMLYTARVFASPDLGIKNLPKAGGLARYIAWSVYTALFRVKESTWL